MKNYDETISTVFKRIDQYKTEKLRKRKTITRIAIPAFSVCLAVAIGIFAVKGDAFKSKPPVTLDDSTVIGEKDYIEPDELNNNSNITDTPSDDTQPDIMKIPGENDTADVLGAVIVDKIQYMQYDVDKTLFTLDEYLGDAREFEGTYNSHINDMPAELYTVKESDNVLVVKLGNGGTVILGRVGEIVIDGKTYFSTQWIANEFTVDKYLGNAEDFELIEVPHRKSYLVPEDEIWTVKENGNILFVKKTNGDILIYSVWE